MVTTNAGHYYNVKGPKENDAASRQKIYEKSIYNFLGFTGQQTRRERVTINGEKYINFFDLVETAAAESKIKTKNLFGEKILNLPVLSSFELKTTYPGLLTGTGYMHPCPEKNDFQMGFFFDWTTGVPVITGSTVKGVLREPFPSRDKEGEKKEGKTEYITSILKKIMEPEETKDLPENFIIELEKSIFEKKGDVFYDAYILPNANGKIFADDYITPHKDEFSEPTPLRFLKIAPKVTFKFQFKLKNSDICDITVTPENKKDLFKKILLDFGIGAKRNTGYGVLVETNNQNE